MNPMQPKPERILFRNLTVFDGTGAPLYAAEVLVEGSQILEVSRNRALAGTDARVIDGRGAVLMPGLIDIHTHLALGSTIEQINKPGDRSDAETALLIAHCGRVMIDHGYTGGYSGGSGSPQAEVAARKAFDAHWVPGPRLKTCSFERVPGGPMGLATRFPGYQARPSNPAEVVDFVREMHAAGVEAVKFLLNGVSAFDARSNLGDQFYDEEIEAAGKRARELGLSLTAHCYTPHAIQLALRAGFNLLYHVGWADEASLDAIEARKDAVFIGPAPGIVEADFVRGPRFGIMASPEGRAEQTEAVERIKRVGAELRRRGIRAIPGGDYGFPWNPIGMNARDLELFVEWFGYTPAETLHAATAMAGEAMGLGGRLGLVKPGALADLLLVDGDPTKDIALLRDRKRLLAIMKDGRFHKSPPAFGATQQ
jgi:imidazolonepropionase-like amidohydrolase